MTLGRAGRFWTAVTESAKSPLWLWSRSRLRNSPPTLPARPKAATPKTPSPQSKTRARGSRFMAAMRLQSWRSRLSMNRHSGTPDSCGRNQSARSFGCRMNPAFRFCSGSGAHGAQKVRGDLSQRETAGVREKATNSIHGFIAIDTAPGNPCRPLCFLPESVPSKQTAPPRVGDHAARDGAN